MRKVHFKIPVIRRSRESGNPEKSRRWIPAYAGMTGFSSFPEVPHWLMKRESGIDIAPPPLKKGE
jgi:hypothetical protein